MDAFLIKPKNNSETELLSALFSKMNIETSRLSKEDIENFGMYYLMKTGNRNEKASKHEIEEILNKQEK